MIAQDFAALERDLHERIAALRSVVVAFSGGVDSAVVLAASARALGPRVLAITGTSASVAEGELEAALALCRGLEVAHETIETREFDNPLYRSNPVNRCFHCKDELYSRLVAVARERDFATVVDGCNADDGHAALDRRPGKAAADKHGVRSPLAEAGIGKEGVRALAMRYGLPVWNKPASPCLSSRVPYGTRIETETLRRIDMAERYLRASGFETVRVRHFGSRARIEVPRERVDALRSIRARVERSLATVGYSEVEIDERGYRTGSLNEIDQS